MCVCCGLSSTLHPLCLRNNAHTHAQCTCSNTHTHVFELSIAQMLSHTHTRVHTLANARTHTHTRAGAHARPFSAAPPRQPSSPYNNTTTRPMSAAPTSTSSTLLPHPSLSANTTPMADRNTPSPHPTPHTHPTPEPSTEKVSASADHYSAPTPTPSFSADQRTSQLPPPMHPPHAQHNPQCVNTHTETQPAMHPSNAQHDPQPLHAPPQQPVQDSPTHSPQPSARENTQVRLENRGGQERGQHAFK